MARRVVVDFQEPRPIASLPAGGLERIGAAFPGWDVVPVAEGADASGDGGGASGEALRAVADAEVYLGFGVGDDLLRAGPGLRWVHTGTAGVRSLIGPAMRASDVVLTNSAGIHAEPMAETVLALVLHFARGLDWAVRAQAERRWDKSAFDAADSPVRELAESTVGVFGLGGIGRAVARRMNALGARVLAVKRHPEQVPGVEVLTGPGALERLLRESDYVVLTAPETDETEGIIDARALAAMRPDAVLVNVARGTLVDEPALVEALREGRLRGAGLDVFATEPLPRDHALWSLPNVLVLPHASAYTHHYWDRELALVEENARRWLAGEELLNVVDKAAGY